MAFEALAEAAERWCARTPFQLIAAEETERRMDFYAEPGVSFYVLCPEAACGDNFVSDRGRGVLEPCPGGPRAARPRGEVLGAGGGAAGRGSPPCEHRKLQDGVVGRCGAAPRAGHGQPPLASPSATGDTGAMPPPQTSLLSLPPPSTPPLLESPRRAARAWLGARRAVWQMENGQG